MWRKEQHFVATKNDCSIDTTILVETNKCSADPGWGNRSLSRGYLNCDEEALTIYKGREFDIFGCDIVVQTTNDHDQCQHFFTGRAIMNTTTSNNGSNVQLTTATIKPSSQKIRTANTSGTVENAPKNCYTTDTTFASLGNGQLGFTNSQLARFDTNFLRQMLPTGSSMNLFKATADDDDWFCTQNFIY